MDRKTIVEIKSRMEMKREQERGQIQEKEYIFFLS